MQQISFSKEMDLDSPNSNSDVWDEIELAESYFTCSMFEKALSLASSVLDRIFHTDRATSIEDSQLADMTESAGMVLVQSLKEMKRTPEVLKELKTLFGSVENIPVQVLLTGAFFQLAEGSFADVYEFLDGFLCKWRNVDGKSYILVSPEQDADHSKGCRVHSILEMDKYMEVVEVYAVTLLGDLLNNTDLAIAWVEKADLPADKQQDLLRRLRSLLSLKATISSQSEKTSVKNEADSEIESNISGGERALKAREQTILKLTEKVEPCFWWFRTVSLKFGSARVVISHGKIAIWGSFFVFICFILQKKHARLKQIASRQAVSVKKALVDLWQLAFSVQVNPLAAVQSLPSRTHGSTG